MKKKLLFAVIIPVIAVSLSGCQFISDYFSNIIDGGNGNNNYQFSQKVASSVEPISDISTPPADHLEARHASMIYSDYIDHSAYAYSCTPSIGEAKLLVIPVWFNDSSRFIKESYKDKVREDIGNAYFGDNDVVGWRSVRTFYEEESHGALEIDGTVSDWYEVNKSYEYYAIDDPTEDNGAPKTSELVKEATKWYFDNHSSEKRTDYDCDNDGYLDGVMLIYAAPDMIALNRDSYENLWAYCYWIQDPAVQKPSNPGLNAFFWASYDYMYGANTALTRSGSRYSHGDTTRCSIDAHTYIHEMGHMFGLEDYYDYSEHGYSPAAGFSMQDNNVGHHDPYSSFALGWGKAIIPNDEATIDLKPFTTSGEMIILSPKWNSYNSAFDEYLIIEYFTSDGLNELDTTYGYMSSAGYAYPMGTKESGIRLWHVDARLLYTLTGEIKASQLTTNVEQGAAVISVNTNTYDDGSDMTRQYLSILASDPSEDYYNAKFANYNLLQLIRNNNRSTYKPTDSLSSKSLFKTGDTFSMDTFSKQFVNGTKLNSGLDLGFSFTVNACNNGYASISIKKS